VKETAESARLGAGLTSLCVHSIKQCISGSGKKKQADRQRQNSVFPCVCTTISNRISAKREPGPKGSGRRFGDFAAADKATRARARNNSFTIILGRSKKEISRS
jgi:hypothetical protein